MMYAGGNVVSHVRLIELVRLEREAARRHVDTTANLRHSSLDEKDARVFRCPGCGDWQYRGRVANHNHPDGRARCQTCHTRLRPQAQSTGVDSRTPRPPGGGRGGG